MTNSRIHLERNSDTVYDEETQNFHTVHEVVVRAKGEEEAKEIAEAVSEEVGEKVSFSKQNVEGESNAE